MPAPYRPEDVLDLEGSVYDVYLQQRIPEVFSSLAQQGLVLSSNANEPVSEAGKVKFRSLNGILQVSYNGNKWTSINDLYERVFDIREFGCNDTPDETRDTTALLAAAAECSTIPGGTNKRTLIKFQPREYRINQQIVLTGNSSSGFLWEGSLGNTFAQLGTSFKWYGDLRAKMFHLRGVCQSDFQRIAFHGNSRARYCVHGEWYTTDPAFLVGSGSSGVRFSQCSFREYRYHGVGMLCGDGPTYDLTVGSSANFTVGEAIWIDDPDKHIAEGRAVVLSKPNSTTLRIHEIIGNCTSGVVGRTVRGLESSASTTIGAVSAIVTGTQNHQFSECIWDTCSFYGWDVDMPNNEALMGTEQAFVGNAAASWAAIAWLSGANNKCYKLTGKTSMQGSRYGLDWYSSSGWLGVDHLGSGNIGNGSMGSLIRTGSAGELMLTNSGFENWAQARAVVNVGAKLSVEGCYFDMIPPQEDQGAFIGPGSYRECTVRNLTDQGKEIRWYTNNNLIIENVEYSTYNADFAGLPIYDGSNNPIGGQKGSSDSLGLNYPITTRNNTIQHIPSGARHRPPDISRQVSPLEGRLWTDGMWTAWAGNTVYAAGTYRQNHGRLYLCTTGGTSGSATAVYPNVAGPSGTGTGITDGTCVWSYVAQVAMAQPGAVTWRTAKKTVGYLECWANSTSLTRQICTVPAGSTIRRVTIDVTTKFIGGTISALTLKSGDGSTSDAYLAAFDAFTAAVTQRGSHLTTDVSWASNGEIYVTLTATGGNLSALTQGSFNIYIDYTAGKYI